MRTKLNLIICLAAAALFVAACSSTTVVARDERPAAEASSDADGTTDSTPDEDTDAEAASDPDAATEDIEAEIERAKVDGFGLGGAEQLDSLLDDCEQSSDLACDVLFQLSAFDTVEETTALTCGGRSENTVEFCTEGIESQGDSPAFEIDSEGLDAVVELCTDDADMTACDFLFYRSPVGSEFEQLGGTCGGRVAVAVPDCRTFLAE